MKRRVLWLSGIPAVALLLAAFWSRGADITQKGATARLMAPGGPTAFETAYGTIITDSPEKARWAEARLAAAVSNFEATFGARPNRGVVVEMPFAAFAARLPEGERRWTLPWMTQYFKSGSQAGLRAGGHHFDNDAGMQHDLSHVFFVKSIVPNTRRPQYGGDAPDWLDEAVALSGETARVKAMRRTQFHQQVCNDRLVPLDRFLQRQHPLFETPAMQKLVSDYRASDSKKPTMMTIRVDQLGLDKDALLDFYAQSQAVTEFLAEMTEDPAILGKVGATVREAAERGDTRPDRWVDAIARVDTPSLAARFDTWAQKSARNAMPDCAGGSVRNRRRAET